MAPVFVDGGSTGRSAATASSTSSSRILEDYVERRYAEAVRRDAPRLSAAAASASEAGTRGGPRVAPDRIRRSTGSVYTPPNVNGRLETWVTPTFFSAATGLVEVDRRGGRAT